MMNCNNYCHPNCYATLSVSGRITSSHHITSHHTEKTEAGLKGLYIREITTVIDLLIRYY